MKLDREEALIRAALEGVETPACDLETGVLRRVDRPPARPVRRLPRAALVAACLALALAVGAAALVGISAHWSYFFTPIPENAVTTVGVSQTVGDYTLTLEDAVVDDNGALLLLALTRADGGEIDPNANFNTFTMHAELNVEGERYSGSSGLQGHRVSEDGKTIYMVFEARDDHVMPGQTILDKKLVFRTDGVAVQLWDPAEYSGGRELKVSLAPLAEAAIPTVEGQWETEPEDRDTMGQRIGAQNVSLPLPLDDWFPQYRVRGAVMTKRGLSIAISGGRARSGDLACNGIWTGDLVDTRDGSRYDFSEGSGVTLPDGTGVMVNSFRDCPLGLEDLPYLELEMTYEMDRVLSDQGFDLRFTPDSGSSVMLPLDTDVTVGGETYHLDELRLSAVKVSVGITDTEGRYEPLRENPPVLTMKDGSTLALDYYGGGARFDREAWTYDGTFTATYAAKDGDGQRMFLDLDQVVSVTFGDLTVQVPLRG